MNATKTFLILCFAISVFLSLTACNTMEGIGEDIQKAGQWAKEKMSD